MNNETEKNILVEIAESNTYKNWVSNCIVDIMQDVTTFISEFDKLFSTIKKANSYFESCFLKLENTNNELPNVNSEAADIGLEGLQEIDTKGGNFRLAEISNSINKILETTTENSKTTVYKVTDCIVDKNVFNADIKHNIEDKIHSYLAVQAIINTLENVGGNNLSDNQDIRNNRLFEISFEGLKQGEDFGRVLLLISKFENANELLPQSVFDKQKFTEYGDIANDLPNKQAFSIGILLANSANGKEINGNDLISLNSGIESGKKYTDIKTFISCINPFENTLSKPESLKDNNIVKQLPFENGMSDKNLRSLDTGDDFVLNWYLKNQTSELKEVSTESNFGSERENPVGKPESGNRVVNLNKSLIENLTIQVKDKKESMVELRRLIESVLLEVLNGSVVG